MGAACALGTNPTKHNELHLKVQSYPLLNVFTEVEKGRKMYKEPTRVCSIKKSWQKFKTLLAFIFSFFLFFVQRDLTMWACALKLMYVSLSVFLWVYDIHCLCDCVCVSNRSDTHLLYERHITLQMTPLDGDGPFNYSALMQSAVNTLNQAAGEDAAYPSSLALFPSLFTSLALSLALTHRHLLVPSLSHLVYNCFTFFF